MQNLDTTSGASCDAYGQLLSGRTSASGSASVTEAGGGGNPSPNSRPNSASQHIHHRRDSDQDKDTSEVAAADYMGGSGGGHPLIIPSYNGAASTAVDEHFEKTRRIIKNESNYGDKGNCR